MATSERPFSVGGYRQSLWHLFCDFPAALANRRLQPLGHLTMSKLLSFSDLPLADPIVQFVVQ
jgi:hypothetical protein